MAGLTNAVGRKPDKEEEMKHRKLEEVRDDLRFSVAEGRCYVSY